MSRSSIVEVPVFADTNLGSRFATAVPPDIRAGELKRELERAHSICFPELGNIDVSALLVRQKSTLYHLPDSIHVKNACGGLRNPWFLHVYACPVKDPQKSRSAEHLARRTSDVTQNVTQGKKTVKNRSSHKWGKKRMKRNWYIKAILQGLTLTTCLLGNKKSQQHILRSCPVRCTPNDLEQKDDDSHGQCTPNDLEEKDDDSHVQCTPNDLEEKDADLGGQCTPSDLEEKDADLGGQCTPNDLEEKDADLGGQCTPNYLEEKDADSDGQCTPNDLEQKDADLDRRYFDWPRLEGCHEQQGIQTAGEKESSRMIEAPCVSPSEVVSVAGIIDKYFTKLIDLDRPDSPSCSKATSAPFKTQMEGKVQPKVENSHLNMCMTNMPQLVDKTPLSIVTPLPTVKRYVTDETPQSIVPPPPTVKRSETDELPQSIVPSSPTAKEYESHEPPQSIVPPPPTVKASESDESLQSVVPPQPTVEKSGTDETALSILPPPPTIKKTRIHTPVVRKCNTATSGDVGASRAKRKLKLSCSHKSETSEIEKQPTVASNSLEKTQAKQKSQIEHVRPDSPSCSDATSTAIQPHIEGQVKPKTGNSHSNMPTIDMPPHFVDKIAHTSVPLPPTTKEPKSQTPFVRKRVRMAVSIGASRTKLRKTRTSCCDQSVIPEVGKRLVSASNSLKKPQAKQKSLLCFYKSQKRSLLGSNTHGPVRHLVFEISDDDN